MEIADKHVLVSINSVYVAPGSEVLMVWASFPGLAQGTVSFIYEM